MTGRDEQGTGGFVLPGLVLLLLAVTAVAHVALLIASMEFRIAGVARDLMVLELAAEGGLRRVMLGDPALPETIALGSSALLLEQALATAELRVEAMRLSHESWLVQSQAESSQGSATRSASVLWHPETASRLAHLSAALVGPATSSVDPGRVDLGAPWAGEVCDDLRARLDSAFTGQAMLVARALTGAGPFGLGPMTLDDVLERVVPGEGGRLTPAPVELANDCVDGPNNWGSPEAPTSACGSRFVVRAFSGDLLMDGGIGQGVVFVDGDAALRSTARLYGMVWATGDLTLEEGSELTGMAVALGGVNIDAGAQIVGSVCWAAAALDSAMDLLSRPISLPNARRLGPY